MQIKESLKLKRRRGNKLILFLSLVLMSNLTMAQCQVKSTTQGSDHTTYYIDPELVAQTSDMGVAISVQMIESNYYLAITYQFASRAVPLEEKVGIELANGYILELEMYTMQGMNAQGVELILAVFNMTEDHMKFFTKSDLAAIHFSPQGGQKKKLPVTSNKDALKRQLICFGKK